MVGTTQCTNPNHGVSTHLTGSMAARMCALQTRRSSTRSIVTIPKMSLAINGHARGNKLGSPSDLQTILRSNAETEFDNAFSTHPDYTREQIAEIAAESIMNDVDDIDAAWSSLDLGIQEENTRARRKVMTSYIEQYVLHNFY